MANPPKARQDAEVVPLAGARAAALAGFEARAGHVMGYHEQTVRRFLRRVLQNEQDAADVFQDMCLRMIRQGRPEPAQTFPRAYLLKVAMNLVRDRMRRAKARRREHHVPIDEVEIVSPEASPEENAHWRQGMEIVGRTLKELDPKRAKVFLLHRVKQLTLREVAEETGLPQRTVERYVIQALDRCRANLERNGWRR